jgi:hypothetical protein
VLVTPDVAMSRSFDESPLMDCHVAFTKSIGPFLRAVRSMRELVSQRQVYVVPARFEWSCDGSTVAGRAPYARTITFCEGPRLTLTSDLDGGLA